MNDLKCEARSSSDKEDQSKHADGPQRILVFHQNGRGESKIQGIRTFGEGLFKLETVSIDVPLPPLLDDASEYLPSDIQADLVLDFLRHPDLSQDLAVLCRNKGIPMVASGKKYHVEGTITPLT